MSLWRTRHVIFNTWISTPTEQAAPVPRLRSLRPAQVGYAAFIVTGIEGDQNGNYSYSVSWKLFGPDGKLVLAYPQYAKGVGKLHSRPSFYLADPALDIILEHSDPSGDYVIEATAVDQVSGKTATSSYKVQLKK